MNKNRFPMILLFGSVILILGLLLAKPCYYLYREAEYHWGDPSSASVLVHNYAKASGVPYGSYPKELIELLERSPETEAFVLGYPERDSHTPDISAYSRDTVPLFLQWDPMWGYAHYGSSYLAITGCGPTCLAMAGYYLTGDLTMTPDRIAAFAENNGYYADGYGSSWTLISEGALELGLKVQELPLVKKKMMDALEDGSLIILALGKGDFTTQGHYILLTGIKNGSFTINDPNSRTHSDRLWSYEELEHQIRNIWAIAS
ncbi:MAG: C39 family peptidase [Oscillospiraceae bacterium]|nr:C39 family peptidase [Oscillospiraceae bacterium]